MHPASNRHNKLMQRMGSVLVNRKSDFVDMLDSADVNASMYDETEELINKYIDNLPDNSDLQVMSSFVLEDVEKSNFDGKIDNDDVYGNYEVFYHYWQPENQSNAGGAVAGAIKGVADLGSKAVDLRTQKKYGATLTAQKKQESKTELIKAVIEQKKAKADQEKAKAEASAKKTKYWLIGGGIFVGLIAIGMTIYFVRKK